MFENVYINNYKKLQISSQIFVFDKFLKKYPEHTEQFYLKNGIINCFFTHYHDAFEMIYVRRGKLECEVDDNKFTAYPGDILVFNPYERHFGYMDNDTEYLEYQCICADLSKLFPQAEIAASKTISEIIEGNMRYDNLISSSDGVFAKMISEYMENIHTFYNQQNVTPGADNCIIGYMYIIMGMFAGSNHIQKSEISEKNGNFALNILQYIEQNYQQKLTSESTAKKFSYNPSYFCRLFKQTFGKTFHYYLTEYRINRAKSDFDALIKSGEISSIADLSAHVGFNDYCYFARSFKKFTGITPSEYFKNIPDK